MNFQYILDDEGNPIPEEDSKTWAMWLQKEQEGKRRVAKDYVGDVMISTVFLGYNHAHRHGPPVLWETMVFEGPLDQEMDRYTNHEAAVEGHKRMVKRVKEQHGNPAPTDD